MADCTRTSVADTTLDTMSQLNTSDEDAIPPVTTHRGKKHIAAIKTVLADPEAMAKVRLGSGKDDYSSWCLQRTLC
jgi:hypothetical protein